MALPQRVELFKVIALIDQQPVFPNRPRTDPEGAQDASQIDGSHGTSVVKKASSI
jgi:hypothetical protein